MKEIDKVEKRDGLIIKNRFGVTSIEHLSSGCKAIILAVSNSGNKCAVSVDGCGENALNVLFKLGKEMDLKNTYTRGKIKI